MKKILLDAKIHGGVVTAANLSYEGSFGIDEEMMRILGIVENEQVHVYNVSNGHRFITYALKLPSGSRRLEPNGACAHLARQGDKVIICTYSQLSLNECSTHKPKIILMKENNEFIVKKK